MSFSFKNARMDRSISAAFEFRLRHHTVECQFRFVAPVPGILKRFDLCAGLFSGRAAKKTRYSLPWLLNGGSR